MAFGGHCQEFATAKLSSLEPTGKPMENLFFDPSTSQWSEAPRWESAERHPGRYRRVWAGPRTLARTGPGYLALEDIDHPGTIRDVIGHAP